jgi:hypothetical protein
VAEVQITLPEGADAGAVERLLEAARAAEAGATDPRANVRW